MLYDILIQEMKMNAVFIFHISRNSGSCSGSSWMSHKSCLAIFDIESDGKRNISKMVV